MKILFPFHLIGRKWKGVEQSKVQDGNKIT